MIWGPYKTCFTACEIALQKAFLRWPVHQDLGHLTLLSRQPLRQPAPIVGAHLLRLQGEEAQLRIQPLLGPPLLRQRHLLKQRGKSREGRSGRSPNALLPVKLCRRLRRNPKYSLNLPTPKLKVPSGTQIALSAHPRAHLTFFNNRFYAPPPVIF